MRSESERVERGVHAVFRGAPTSDGAGVRLVRVIGTPALRNLDPFLMLDEFGSDRAEDYRAGFPEHPHRGFETITYMIAGNFRHRDNHGHEGFLRGGGAQWMTAGRGIVHSEMPEQDEGLVWGFQLWLNLPAAEKMRDPSYLDIQPGDIPRVALEGATCRVLAGEALGLVGPISGRATEPMIVDLDLAGGASIDLDIPHGHQGFVYVFQGAGIMVEGATSGARAHAATSDARAQAASLGKGDLGVLADGDFVRLRSSEQTRLLVVAGKPLREPIVQYGPFVMNTRRQIDEAIADYRAGRF